MTSSDALAKTLQSQMAALREITRAISAAWSLEQILALITRKTARVMDVDSCSIYLLDRDGVHGMPRFHKAAAAAGIRAIVGAEVTKVYAQHYGSGIEPDEYAMLKQKNDGG